MSKQVQNVCKTAYIQLRRISSIRHLLTPKATQTLICSLVLSRLDYCNSLLYGLPDATLGRLRRVQNMAARIISRSKRYDHITPVLYNLHWLPIEARIKYKLLLHVFKAVKCCGPSYLSDLVNVYVPSRPLRSATGFTLIVPSKTKTLGDRSFVVAGPVLLNSLPVKIRTLETVDQFKRAIKTHLFSEYF